MLAERLGLDPAALMHVRGADGRDAIDAQAMNMALAPGTLGYMAGTLMSPVFEGWVDELIWFFGGYVSGRGADPGDPHRRPALRHRRHDRLLADGWLQRRARRPVPSGASCAAIASGRSCSGCTAMLGVLEASWRTRASGVSRVGAGADPHETLLDILGLHPASAEFHTRTGKQPRRDLLARPPGRLSAARHPRKPGRAPSGRPRCRCSSSFGYAGRDPDILDLFFRAGQIKLKGPIDRGSAALRDHCRWPRPRPDHRNYLTWLADAARRLARRPAPAGGLHRRHSRRTRSSTSCSSSR